MIEERKFYLTADGLKRLKKEYESLKKLKLAKTKGEEAPRILHSEDLDPEYLAFEEDMGFLEARLMDLEAILKNAELIKLPPKDQRNKVVTLGATVIVEVAGQKDEFTIVGTLEANPETGRISNESPLGQALLGRRVGDEVVVSSPVKTIYKIKKVKHQLS